MPLRDSTRKEFAARDERVSQTLRSDQPPGVGGHPLRRASECCASAPTRAVVGFDALGMRSRREGRFQTSTLPSGPGSGIRLGVRIRRRLSLRSFCWRTSSRRGMNDDCWWPRPGRSRTRTRHLKSSRQWLLPTSSPTIRTRRRSTSPNSIVPLRRRWRAHSRARHALTPTSVVMRARWRPVSASARIAPTSARSRRRCSLVLRRVAMRGRSSSPRVLRCARSVPRSVAIMTTCVVGSVLLRVVSANRPASN